MGTDLITLELSAKTKVGTITTNARLLLEQVKAGVEKYLSPDYEPDEKTAKADRAMLNKAARAIDEERKRVEAAYNAPLAEFHNTCKEIKEAVGGAVAAIGEAVDAYEWKRKQAKREQIEKLFALRKFDLLPLGRILNPRWLNKTYPLEDIAGEIDAATGKIYADLKTVEGLSEYATIAKSKYLDTLDLGAALAEVQRLRENAERLASEKAERGKREEEKAERDLAAMERAAADTPPAGGTKSLLDMSEPEEPPPEEDAVTFTLTFTATREKCRALKRYMLDNGIAYEKVDMGLYQLKTVF
jgi:hypothetical protein